MAITFGPKNCLSPSGLNAFIFSYIKFCFEFAHFCTMDFRYIAITVVFGALYIGLLLKHREENNKMFDKILRNSLCVLVGIFAVSSLAIYLTAG